MQGAANLGIVFDDPELSYAPKTGRHISIILKWDLRLKWNKKKMCSGCLIYAFPFSKPKGSLMRSQCFHLVDNTIFFFPQAENTLGENHAMTLQFKRGIQGFHQLHYGVSQMKRRSFIHLISNGRLWQRRGLRVCTFQLLACCEPDTPQGIQKKFLKHENLFSPNSSASSSPPGARAGKQDPRGSENIGIPSVDFAGLWIRPWVFKDSKLVKLLGEWESSHMLFRATSWIPHCTYRHDMSSVCTDGDTDTTYL